MTKWWAVELTGMVICDGFRPSVRNRPGPSQMLTERQR
jgi:hypothetical protein